MLTNIIISLLMLLIVTSTRIKATRDETNVSRVQFFDGFSFCHKRLCPFFSLLFLFLFSTVQDIIIKSNLTNDLNNSGFKI